MSSRIYIHTFIYQSMNPHKQANIQHSSASTISKPHANNSSFNNFKTMIQCGQITLGVYTKKKKKDFII